MSPECAWDTVLNAAVAQWAGNTAQHELREALDQVLEQVGDNTLRRALELRWSRRDSRGRQLIGAWLSPDTGGTQADGRKYETRC
jgi:hypothetical protein